MVSRAVNAAIVISLLFIVIPLIFAFV
jgi:hypothetical protein